MKNPSNLILKIHVRILPMRRQTPENQDGADPPTKLRLTRCFK